MRQELTKRDVLFSIGGFLVAIAIGVITWMITENQRLNSEIIALQHIQTVVEDTAKSSEHARIVALEAEELLSDAESKVEQIYAAIDTSKALTSADNQMEELRIIAKSEAERIVNGYLEENIPLPILATLTVKNGKLVEGSSDVTFNNGVVTFQNPQGIPYVPIISDYLNNNYMTTKSFIKEISSNNQFVIWETTLDTSGRNNAPKNFTAVVIGIDLKS